MRSRQQIIWTAMLVCLLACPIRAGAEEVLKALNSGDFLPDANGTSRVVPLYGGSDQSGFTVQYDVTNPALITILHLDLSGAEAGADAIVGMFECRSMRGAALILYAGGKILSSFPFPDAADQTAFESFKLPLPSGFASRKLTLSFQPPNVIRPGDGVAFANLRLVRGEPAKSTAVVTPSMPVNSGSPWVEAAATVQTLREFSDNDFDSHILMTGDFTPKPLSLMAAPPGGATASVFVDPVGVLRTIPILALDDPPITQSNYAISGNISYGGIENNNDVEGYGYLEMWSDFADGSSYFSRTLAGSGPLRQIRGRSGPRPFLLPFNAADKHPTRIRMNLVMSSRGTVSMTDLKLVQYLPAVAAGVNHTVFSGLFSPRLLWIPVAVLPLFALVAFMEPLVSRGKARILVLIWNWIFFVLAEVSIGWAMAAMGHGLSIREVWPTLFTGCLILICTLFAGPKMSRRYRDAELRKMQLMDAV